MNARLAALAGVLAAFPGSTVIDIADDDLGAHALAYATAGWEVFPLHGKVPLTNHGVLDATCDPGQVAGWWAARWPNANIGGRVPAGVVVVDVDPRSGGDVSWAALTAEHGDVATRTALSGRGDDGGHRYYRHPGGKLRGTIGAGLDVKTHAGYTVLPPSLHPATGKPYRWVEPAAPIAPPPAWLVRLLRREPSAPKAPTASRASYSGDSIADWYTATHTWGDVLTRHGWALVAGSGDDDGSRWRHPAASHAWSATVKHELLFVYSPNTPFAITEAEHPHGYTRFRAYTLLDHHGDLSAAARAARVTRCAA